MLRALGSDRGYDLLQALHSASCAITHETGGTICYGHWVLRLVISHTRQRLELVSTQVLRRICCRCLGLKYDLLPVSGARTNTQVLSNTICCRCLGLELVPKCYEVRVVARERGYDLIRALGSVSCDITHETGGTICYGHWVLRLVISHTRQGVRFVTGIGFCVLSYYIGDRGYDLLRALGSVACDITHETGGTI